MTKSWACTKNSKLTRINCVYVQFKPILVHSVFIQFHVARCALARFNITNYTQARWVKCNDPFCQLHLKTVLALKMIAKIVVSFHLEFCSRAYMFLCSLTRERANHAANSKTNRLQHLPICVFVSPLSSGISVWPAIHCCKKKQKKKTK